MKRLFHFTGYRLSVLHWKGKKLVGTSSFEPTGQGLDNFRHYLLETENISSKFLVDVIEEDFRNETVPHVGGKDRKAVIRRLIDRYYRASQDYCYSEVLGRQEGGRKDDIVLLGAMTNPQLIQPWLNILDECETPLSGIWTVPLISKKILKLIKATTGVVLLVSQQVNSNVRQTLFRDGKLISSRQSIINQDISDISGMGKLAAPEVDRTIDFLRTQNLINEKEVISLHVLGSEEQMPSLQQYFKSSDSRTVNIHLISELQQKLGLSGVSNKFSAELFSWLCISQGVAFSHYGDRQLFNRYFNKLAATSLYVASLLVLITGVLLTEENISDAMEYEKSITLLKIEEKSYKDLYSKKFKDFEEVFENAGVMNSAVELAERIKINSTTSPLDFLLAISDILSQGDEQVLHIDRIEWQAVNINEKNNKINDASFVGKLAVKHNAIIFGRIDVPDNDYRESINHIRKIVKYLEASPRIENVETLKMPVDLRSESKFSTESGVEIKPQGRNSVSGVFSLKVIMKAPDRV